MAFDVYAGTMTRFYRREWENTAQRMAREQGHTYRQVYAGGPPGPPPAADEVRAAVRAWLQAMNTALAPHGCSPVEWVEADNQPYFTDRPGWPGYSALLVWAAHAEHSELPLPTSVPESWADDPAFQKSTEPNFKTNYRAILEPQLWLPAEFPFTFDFPTLTSEQPSAIGSTFALRFQLDQLKAKTSTNLAAGNDLAQTATFAIDTFRTLADQACTHRLPLLLSF
jgi:hypothetical protein